MEKLAASVPKKTALDWDQFTETIAQLEILRRLQCDEWQGFLFSRAVPSGEFQRLLAANAESLVAMAGGPDADESAGQAPWRLAAPE